jgi:dolichol-phosphate mannosyltransferase
VVELSIVVPVYNCDGCLRVLHERLTAALEPLGITHELVLVDDRSTDESWSTVLTLASRDDSVKAIRLSRNFGQHAAITAGLAAAQGRWTVVMDCDLQDPPELVPVLYAKAQEGHELVLGRRVQRSHSWARRFASRMYFHLLNLFLDTKIDGEYGTFSILSDKVRRAFLSIKDKDRHYLHIVFWLGFDHATIDYELAEREAGRSSYTLGRLLGHAFDGIFFQTTTLLRWIVYLGFALAAAGVSLAVALIAYAIFASPLPGWTSLSVLILLVGGFIVVSTGVTGLYIGRIFRQVKDRPLYVVDTALVGKGAGERELTHLTRAGE